jgi:hypothetical protein
MTDSNGGEGHSSNGRGEKRSHRSFRQKIRYTFSLILGGILTAIGLAIWGLVTSSYVEISFKDPRSAWNEPSKWMDLHIDVTEPKLFKAFYGDNDNGKTIIREATFSLKFSKLTNKLLGTKERTRDHATYALNGFWKDEEIVITSRGLRGGGEAVYMLKPFPVSEVADNIYTGYVVTEDWKRGNEDWAIKCPFLMVGNNIADRFQDGAAAARQFPFLSTKCGEFIMPKSLDNPVNEAKPIDAILAEKD